MQSTPNSANQDNGGHNDSEGEFRQTSPTSDNLIPPYSGRAIYTTSADIAGHLLYDGLLTVVGPQLTIERMLNTTFARMLTFSGGSDVEGGNTPGHVNVPC